MHRLGQVGLGGGLAMVGLGGGLAMVGLGCVAECS